MKSKNILINAKDTGLFQTEKNIFTVIGKLGKISRVFNSPNIQIKIESGTVCLRGKNVSKKDKAILNTYKAHLKNMFYGVENGYIYKLKICSSHFPMTASVENNQFVVKNFLGETTPRNIDVKEDVNIKIEGSDIIVESANKELAGQTAASIEKLCKIKGRDKRIFQDGIWMTEKAGKIIK